jgi:hypothetical protein
MCCLSLLAFGIGPRLALLVWWIFGDKPDEVFSGNEWVLGFLGFLVLPWTTLMYIATWQPIVGIDGFWAWFFIALGVALDIATYAAKPARERYAA